MEMKLILMMCLLAFCVSAEKSTLTYVLPDCSTNITSQQEIHDCALIEKLKSEDNNLICSLKYQDCIEVIHVIPKYEEPSITPEEFRYMYNYLYWSSIKHTNILCVGNDYSIEVPCDNAYCYQCVNQDS